MPFTFSHPAAVLPIHRLAGSRIPLSALVIGSMAPDFAYFLPFVSRVSSHSLEGLVLFCLPAGWLVDALFQTVLRRPLIAILPRGLASRLEPVSRSPVAPGQLAGALIGIVGGAATHIAWDSFTHLN